MKKFGIFYLACLLLFLAGCGQASAAESEAAQVAALTQGVQDYAQGVDVDLTQMSSTMVYSEVYNMVSSPDDYEGKTVKMRGTFSYYHDDNRDKDYFSCIIADATACCSQGIEFVLAQEATYPDDYPALGEEITVAGVFHTYEEDGYLFCQLLAAEQMT